MPKTHGKSGTPEHRIWKGMIKRCANPNATDYHKYGARGISVCAEWTGLDGFVRFLAYVGCRPSSEHSIDRYPDHKGGYAPGNVRWATRAEQQNNRRNSRWVEWRGEKKTIGQWAALHGLKQDVLHHRLKLGWDMTRALSSPVRSAQ